LVGLITDIDRGSNKTWQTDPVFYSVKKKKRSGLLFLLGTINSWYIFILVHIHLFVIYSLNICLCFYFILFFTFISFKVWGILRMCFCLSNCFFFLWEISLSFYVILINKYLLIYFFFFSNLFIYIIASIYSSWWCNNVYLYLLCFYLF
jgi:hypothetical protein